MAYQWDKSHTTLVRQSVLETPDYLYNFLRQEGFTCQEVKKGNTPVPCFKFFLVTRKEDVGSYKPPLPSDDEPDSSPIKSRPAKIRRKTKVSVGPPLDLDEEEEEEEEEEELNRLNDEEEKREAPKGTPSWVTKYRDDIELQFDMESLPSVGAIMDGRFADFNSLETTGLYKPQGPPHKRNHSANADLEKDPKFDG
ncbi:MAG: hypothetical protein MMC33_006852, partial [Icmadophila ericetorum]|nr:hypothetical protein [Icmadophila ericetorum]